MKHFYALVFSAALSMLSAQSGLSNMSFENWTSGLPDGWDGFGTITQKTTGAQHGNSYCELKTSATSPAMLMVGEFSGNGVPYSSPVAQLSGFYRVSGMSANEFAGIAAGLRKAGQSIGAGGVMETTNKTSWTSFAATVFTTQPGPPDSITIILTSPSGNSVFTPGAVLDVDHLILSATVGMDEASLGTSFLVYPNPASDHVRVASPGGHFQFFLLSADGRLVKQVFAIEESVEISLGDLPAGIYFYTATGDDSDPVNGKLAVE